MGLWTTPRQWADGDDLSGTLLNAQVRDLLNSLYSPPSCNVYLSTGFSVTNATATLISFDAELWDQDWGPGSTGAWHSTVSQTSRVIVPYDGLYEVVAYWQWASPPGAGNSSVNLRVNAAGSSGGGTSVKTVVTGSNRTDCWVMRRQFTAGDYLEMFATQSSGAAITINGGAQVTGLSARWIGA